MDYSLLVGIHDKVRAEEEAIQMENANRDGMGRETSESEECDSGERYIDKIIRNYLLVFIILCFTYIDGRITLHRIHQGA